MSRRRAANMVVYQAAAVVDRKWGTSAVRWQYGMVALHLICMYPLELV